MVIDIHSKHLRCDVCHRTLLMVEHPSLRSNCPVDEDSREALEKVAIECGWLARDGEHICTGCK